MKNPSRCSCLRAEPHVQSQIHFPPLFPEIRDGKNSCLSFNTKAKSLRNLNICTDLGLVRIQTFGGPSLEEYLSQVQEGCQHGWRCKHKLTKDVTTQVEWRERVAVDPACNRA